MAVYLGVFAVTMLLQFTSYFMSSSHKLLQNDEEVNISKVDKTNKVSIENMESQ
jgi:hypothetical protein